MEYWLCLLLLFTNSFMGSESENITKNVVMAILVKKNDYYMMQVIIIELLQTILQTIKTEKERKKYSNDYTKTNKGALKTVQ